MQDVRLLVFLVQNTKGQVPKHAFSAGQLAAALRGCVL